MKRRLALWAIVSLCLIATFASASAQVPVEASGDTLRTDAPAPAPADTAAASAGAQARRAAAADARSGALKVVFSLGLGTAINYNPNSFSDNYDPSFGLMLSGGVRRSGVTLTATIDYNFFFAARASTDDLNVLMLFADVRYTPASSTARPYLLACGGLYRTWIVDLDYTETVLGYGGGAGVEVEIDVRRRMFLEGRYIQAQTRERTEAKANTEIIPIRIGLTWEF